MLFVFTLPKLLFVSSAGATNVNMMKRRRKRTMMAKRKRRRQKNLLMSLLKTPTRKKVAAARKQMKWPLPWKQSSMTSFDMKKSLR